MKNFSHSREPREHIRNLVYTLRNAREMVIKLCLKGITRKYEPTLKARQSKHMEGRDPQGARNP